MNSGPNRPVTNIKLEQLPKVINFIEHTLAEAIGVLDRPTFEDFLEKVVNTIKNRTLKIKFEEWKMGKVRREFREGMFHVLAHIPEHEKLVSLFAQYEVYGHSDKARRAFYLEFARALSMYKTELYGLFPEEIAEKLYDCIDVYFGSGLGEQYYYDSMKREQLPKEEGVVDFNAFKKRKEDTSE